MECGVWLGSKRQAPPPPLSSSVSLKPPHPALRAAWASSSLHPRATGYSLSFLLYNEFVSPRGFLVRRPSPGPSCGQRGLCAGSASTPDTWCGAPHPPQTLRAHHGLFLSLPWGRFLFVPKPQGAGFVSTDVWYSGGWARGLSFLVCSMDGYQAMRPELSPCMSTRVCTGIHTP